jgi:hypothetical protein
VVGKGKQKNVSFFNQTKQLFTPISIRCSLLSFNDLKEIRGSTGIPDVASQKVVDMLSLSMIASFRASRRNLWPGPVV